MMNKRINEFVSVGLGTTRSNPASISAPNLSADTALFYDVSVKSLPDR